MTEISQLLISANDPQSPVQQESLNILNEYSQSSVEFIQFLFDYIKTLDINDIQVTYAILYLKSSLTNQWNNLDQDIQDNFFKQFNELVLTIGMKPEQGRIVGYCYGYMISQEKQNNDLITTYASLFLQDPGFLLFSLAFTTHVCINFNDKHHQLPEDFYQIINNLLSYTLKSENEEIIDDSIEVLSCYLINTNIEIEDDYRSHLNTIFQLAQNNIKIWSFIMNFPSKYCLEFVQYAQEVLFLNYQRNSISIELVPYYDFIVNHLQCIKFEDLRTYFDICLKLQIIANDENGLDATYHQLPSQALVMFNRYDVYSMFIQIIDEALESNFPEYQIVTIFTLSSVVEEAYDLILQDLEKFLSIIHSFLQVDDYLFKEVGLKLLKAMVLTNISESLDKKQIIEMLFGIVTQTNQNPDIIHISYEIMICIVFSSPGYFDLVFSYNEFINFEQKYFYLIVVLQSLTPNILITQEQYDYLWIQTSTLISIPNLQYQVFGTLLFINLAIRTPYILKPEKYRIFDIIIDGLLSDNNEIISISINSLAFLEKYFNSIFCNLMAKHSKEIFSLLNYEDFYQEYIFYQYYFKILIQLVKMDQQRFLEFTFKLISEIIPTKFCRSVLKDSHKILYLFDMEMRNVLLDKCIACASKIEKQKDLPILFETINRLIKIKPKDVITKIPIEWIERVENLINSIIYNEDGSINDNMIIIYFQISEFFEELAKYDRKSVHDWLLFLLGQLQISHKLFIFSASTIFVPMVKFNIACQEEMNEMIKYIEFQYEDLKDDNVTRNTFDWIRYVSQIPEYAYYALEKLPHLLSFRVNSSDDCESRFSCSLAILTIVYQQHLFNSEYQQVIINCFKDFPCEDRYISNEFALILSSIFESNELEHTEQIDFAFMECFIKLVSNLWEKEIFHLNDNTTRSIHKIGYLLHQKNSELYKSVIFSIYPRELYPYKHIVLKIKITRVFNEMHALINSS